MSAIVIAAPTVTWQVGRAMGEPDFDAFFRRMWPELFRLALARTGSPSVAEDIAQEVLADAHRRWVRVGRYDRPDGWARRAVLNRSVSRFRRWGAERRGLERLRSERADDVGEPVLADEELWEAIRRLSRRQQAVVLLRWFEELSTAEVAATLDCGEETVRTHWRRARARLAADLGASDAEPVEEPADPQEAE